MGLRSPNHLRKGRDPDLESRWGTGSVDSGFIRVRVGCFRGGVSSQVSDSFVSRKVLIFKTDCLSHGVTGVVLGTGDVLTFNQTLGTPVPTFKTVEILYVFRSCGLLHFDPTARVYGVTEGPGAQPPGVQGETEDLKYD